MPTPRTPRASRPATTTAAADAAPAAPSHAPGDEILGALRGVGRLAVDAVVATTDIAEHLHRTILDLSPIVGAPRPDRTRGIPGVVYGGVRRVARTAGAGVDIALARVPPRWLGGAPLWAARAQQPAREAALAALNGVVGDHLAATGNPLAIDMRLRRHGDDAMPGGEPAPAVAADARGNVMILVHGLCMNDLQWRRDGHDHGEALANALGYAPLYLHYNSGRRISWNGRAFAALMQRLFERWPVPIDRIAIVGHSMGGLVARSACDYARHAGHPWLGRLERLVFLGTPHHGAPLERAGNRIDRWLRMSPYTAPFSRLGRIRSAGVQDLRYSNLRDEDWEGRSQTHATDPRTPVALPAGVACYAIAASTQRDPAAGGNAAAKRAPSRAALARARGDGLVAVNSALGIHARPGFSLPIPPSRRAVVYGVDHFALLGSAEVYARIHAWLRAPVASRSPKTNAAPNPQSAQTPKSTRKPRMAPKTDGPRRPR